MSASGIVSVYAVFASDEEARRIGRAMIEQRLAACVNIIGRCHSIYRWEGKTEQADEVAAIFKTAAAQADALIAAIAVTLMWFIGAPPRQAEIVATAAVSPVFP